MKTEYIIEPDPNQIKKDFIFRMLTPIITAFCAEFGIQTTREMIKYIADFDPFWAITRNITKEQLDFLNRFFDGQPK